MKRKIVIQSILSLALTVCFVFVTGCSLDKTAKDTTASDTATASASQPIETSAAIPIIAVTIVPEQAFVKAVCGDNADVIVMVPPGNSPENFEPTAEAMAKFSDASLYFAIGVPTEEANIMPNVGDVRVIALADKVAEVYPERTFESGGRDPHIWLSPKRVKVMIEVIAQEMSQLDPNNSDVYNNNANAYIEQLDDLDKEILTALEGVQSKKIIVYHPAFGYLTDDYGLEMYALEKNGKEATVQQLQEMIDLAKAENIKVIFYQEEIDSSQSEAFAEEIEGKTLQLAPLSVDYIQNLKNMAETMAEVMQ